MRQIKSDLYNNFNVYVLSHCLHFISVSINIQYRIRTTINKQKETIDKLTKDNKSLNNEVKLLEAQIQSLQKDNELLKIEITKLDKLIYGRVSNKSSSKQL